MGNAESGFAGRKLAKELPSTQQMPKVFPTEADRQQFISAVIAITTANGSLDLTDHEFNLVYSPRSDASSYQTESKSNHDSKGKANGNANERIIARILAIKDGVIKAKIETKLDGETHEEALLALRKEVEGRLETLLGEVPDVNGGAAAGSVGGDIPEDAPPAYEGSVGDIGDKAGKA